MGRRVIAATRKHPADTGHLPPVDTEFSPQPRAAGADSSPPQRRKLRLMRLSNWPRSIQFGSGSTETQTQVLNRLQIPRDWPWTAWLSDGCVHHLPAACTRSHACAATTHNTQSRFPKMHSLPFDGGTCVSPTLVTTCRALQKSCRRKQGNKGLWVEDLEKV